MASTEGVTPGGRPTFARSREKPAKDRDLEFVRRSPGSERSALPVISGCARPGRIGPLAAVTLMKIYATYKGFQKHL
jgi:hypothetical protein